MAKYVLTVTKKNGRRYHYSRVPIDGTYLMLRLPDDFGEACAVASEMRDWSPDLIRRYMAKERIGSAAKLEHRRDLGRYLSSLVHACRARAKARNQEFGISVAGVRATMEKQAFRCIVSGIPFSFEAQASGDFTRAFAPSIDRIDSSKGYVDSNVRIVCRIVNFAANQWGIEAVRRMARGICGQPIENEFENSCQKVYKTSD